MLFKIEVSLIPESEAFARSIERKMLGKGYERVGYHEDDGVVEFLFKMEREYPFKMTRGEESDVLALNIESELTMLLARDLFKPVKAVVTAI